MTADSVDWKDIADNLTRRVTQMEQRLQQLTQVVAGHTTTLESYHDDVRNEYNCVCCTPLPFPCVLQSMHMSM